MDFDVTVLYFSGKKLDHPITSVYEQNGKRNAIQRKVRNQGVVDNRKNEETGKKR